MASPLVRIPFDQNLLLKVQGFDCGVDPWEKEVSDWIKSPPGAGGAVDALSRNTEVWLYATPSGEIVGFGSLGTTWQRWPSAKAPKILASVLPMLGIDKKYWGQPPGPREQRYSSLILDDLIAEARKHAAQCPILILFVNENNLRAMKVYERAGFTELHRPIKDKATGFVNKRMVLVLTAPP